ncbi:ABC transporter substrate-binding protein [Neptunomonas sp.]|uniref:ABC transporter substrate-binding protein n=1 Tax=Neptunomonas sp. TaxID=1971898 RepID=UPI0035658F61
MFSLFYKPVFLLLIVIFSLPGCTSEQPGTLKVGTNVWPGYEPLYLARASDLWEPGRISIIEYNSASEVLRAFRNDSLDVAALTLDEAISLIADRPDTRIFMGIDFSAGADVVIVQPDIEVAGELRGKSVGVESTAVGAYILARFLEVNQLVLSDINIVFMAVDRHAQAFSQREVDAVVTFEPVKTQLLKQGGRTLFSSNDIPGEVLDVLVTRQDVIQKKAKQLQALTAGWFQSLTIIKEHREVALLKMAPRMGISSQELDIAMQGLKLLDSEDNQHLLRAENATINETAIKIERLMLSNGLLAKPVFNEGYINSQFVDKK